MSVNDEPIVLNSRWLVWTDDRAEQGFSRSTYATWFWAASGPRGHKSGAESTAEEARERAYAAYHLLLGKHEKAPA